jgi:hypothetical protein
VEPRKGSSGIKRGSNFSKRAASVLMSQGPMALGIGWRAVRRGLQIWIP